MVEYEYSDLFYQSNVPKEIKMQFGDTTIGNDKIYQESFELAESLCSNEELKFGCCEAAVAKIKIRNEFGNLQGKDINLSLVLNGNDTYPFQIGKYKIDKCELSGDKNYADITAYDVMYDIINMNVASWYDGLTFPLTLKEFRDSFFEHVGVEQEDIALIQDSMIIDKTISTDELSGLKVASAICEINGVFGRISRQGKFVYVSIIPKQDELYPNEELYPSDSLYPGEFTADGSVQTYETYISCEYEEFETEYISSLQIRQETDDIGVIIGDGSNRYVVEDNFLVYGKEIDDLTAIAEMLYEKIKEVQYRPFKSESQGNPCVEVGDAIVFYTRNMDVESYVFERTLKGIQSLRDTFESKGSAKYENNLNSTHKEIVKLKGKSNVLERSVEETRETISDVEEGLRSEIVQNVSEISQTISQTSTNLENEISEIKSAQSSVKQTIDEFSIEFEGKIQKLNEQEETIEDLKKTSYKFGTEDLTIEKTGSSLSTKINENGMRVLEDGDEVLVANSSGVDAKNLHATTYLIIGANSRFEDYQGDKTACFYIGG